MGNETVKIDSPLVRRLIASQFPQWRDMTVAEVLPNGWDNRTFRLGDQMSVRLPSAERYVAQVAKEHRWLPFLAAGLPLPIPVPLAKGEAGEGFPWQWSIYGWIEGEIATVGPVANLSGFAVDLAAFLRVLGRIDVSDAPSAGEHNFFRGGDLSVYDGESRQAIEVLENNSDLDTALVSEVWDTALDSAWSKPPIWIHGDVSSGNLLVRDGRLSGVIDFGGMAVGDPACDLAIAWTMFDGDSRQSFRDGVDLDDSTWARARGWTLWKALIILSGVSETNAAEGELARRTIDRILADHRGLG
jgi:aminoglycoside phosphotransferase (APT) family kinase protein